MFGLNSKQRYKDVVGLVHGRTKQLTEIYGRLGLVGSWSKLKLNRDKRRNRVGSWQDLTVNRDKKTE